MRHFPITLAALAVVSTAAIAEVPAPAKFVAEAGASDRFEIDSARLLVSSKNPRISKFATMMITDHAKSTKMVTAAARADHLAPKPPSLTIGQRADITALKAVPAGKTRDDLYVKQQKAAHADALTLMQGYAAEGTARHLKTAAGKIAPVVQGHIASLDTM